VENLDLVTLFTWLGILVCISQAGMFSGLNLALFSISRLRLEVEASTGNLAARKILSLRQDSHFLLSTILWGNVGVNVLLTLLSDSVMLGASAFIFSTVVITVFGEIVPQAYFSRNALRFGAGLAPVLKVYSFVLYPVAKPSALLLDRWLGKEGIQYFYEHNMREVIRRHINAEDSDIDRVEGVGVLNFLAFDDLLATQEGEPVDPDSIISLPYFNGRVLFPPFRPTSDDLFLKQVHTSHKKWVIITDEDNEPVLVLNANAFLRAVIWDGFIANPLPFCHRPIVIRDSSTLLGSVISKLKVTSMDYHDDVIDNDLVLLWGDQQRVITGADILGRLMRGIVVQEMINK